MTTIDELANHLHYQSEVMAKDAQGARSSGQDQMWGLLQGYSHALKSVARALALDFSKDKTLDMLLVLHAQAREAGKMYGQCLAEGEVVLSSYWQGRIGGYAQARQNILGVSVEW